MGPHLLRVARHMHAQGHSWPHLQVSYCLGAHCESGLHAYLGPQAPVVVVPWVAAG